MVAPMNNLRSSGPAGASKTKRLWMLVGLLLLAGHVVFFTWHTDRAAQAFNLSAVPPNTIDGVPEPRFFLEADSYAWLAHTRDLMNSGDWRIRHTYMDNAPYGRETHWSHLLIWTLRGMATAILAATGWPAARAVELAGVWSMPLFQVLFLSIAFFALFRKTGWLPATGLVFVCLTYEPVAIAFFPLKPDHHALQLFFVLASFACLQFGGMGWTRTPDRPGGTPAISLGFPAIPERREARRWFIASGVFGGLALWVGATVWLISLAGIALAMLPALPLFHSPQKDEEAYLPALWRSWAAAGCLIGLVGYLLEYAPHHFSMRLEVNHPLYWISWLGVALGIERLAHLRRPLPSCREGVARLWLPAVLALALPLAVFLGPAAWHQMHDPFLKRLHAQYITEFLPPSIVREGHFLSFPLIFRVCFLAVPWVGFLLFFRRIRTPHRRRLFSAAILYAGLCLAAALFQQRWGFSLAAALVWLTLLSLIDLFSPEENSRATLSRLLGGSWLALLLLDGLYSDFSRLRLEKNIADNTALPQSWIESNLQKRNALRWGLAAGTNHWRFVGVASDVPMLYYFSGIPSVASFYWENAAGWRAEAALLADTSPQADAARKIAQERGLTHIVSVIQSSCPAIYYFIASGHHDPVFAALHTLDGWLTYSPFTNRPSWTAIDEPLSQIGQSGYVFKTPSGYAKEKLQYQVFSIHPDR